MSRSVFIREQWEAKIFNPEAAPFEMLAIEAFQYQVSQNLVYKAYVEALGIDPNQVDCVTKIPFIPISFFKTHMVKNGQFSPAICFESSATTGMTTSKHFVKEPALYRSSFIRGFERFWGSLKDWCIIGLLPSYLERKNSSLVYMTDSLIRESGHSKSGFYLHDTIALHRLLTELESQEQATFLIGVTFALLDFAASHPVALKHTKIIETGGMKGRGQELVRADLHARLQIAFGPNPIGAEYGMTELLSQAWSYEKGIFACPPWMRVMVRDEEDPLSVQSSGSGALNIIDLANIDSCCFIATEDAGKVYENRQFEMLGRMDGSDLRGCSLLTV